MTEAEWADMERLLPTPCYVVDEALIEENLKILKGVMDRTGASWPRRLFPCTPCIP